jgi:phage-related minor tail protein
MAAKTIKGITVEIGGNTTGLGKALKEVEKQSSKLSSELKAVDKALKLDPTNTVLLAEKQKILAEAVEETKEKLETLKSVQDQIRQQYEAGDIDRGAYLDFQNELAYTEAKLEQLEEQQRSFGSVTKQVMEEAGKKVSEFGDKITNAGKKIADVGEKFLPVTAAITAAGAYAVSAGSDMIESQNKVEVAFGNSAEKVMQFAETTLDAFGISKGSALDIAALFGDMATSMELPTDAAAEMSISLVGLAGDLASFKNLELEEASNALKGIFTGETEALKNLGIVMNQDNLLRFAM